MRKVFHGVLAAAAAALLFVVPAWAAAEPAQFVKINHTHTPRNQPIDSSNDLLTQR